MNNQVKISILSSIVKDVMQKHMGTISKKYEEIDYDKMSEYRSKVAFDHLCKLIGKYLYRDSDIAHYSERFNTFEHKVLEHSGLSIDDVQIGLKEASEKSIVNNKNIDLGSAIFCMKRNNDSNGYPSFEEKNELEENEVLVEIYLTYMFETKSLRLSFSENKNNFSNFLNGDIDFYNNGEIVFNNFEEVNYYEKDNSTIEEKSKSCFQKSFMNEELLVYLNGFFQRLYIPLKSKNISKTI